MPIQYVYILALEWWTQIINTSEYVSHSHTLQLIEFLRFQLFKQITVTFLQVQKDVDLFSQFEEGRSNSPVWESADWCGKVKLYFYFQDLHKVSWRGGDLGHDP